MLESVHTEPVLVAGVKGSPCTTDGVVCPNEMREQHETINNVTPHYMHEQVQVTSGRKKH